VPCVLQVPIYCTVLYCTVLGCAGYEAVHALPAFWVAQQKVSGKELEALLSEERQMPIVIDFYATWCGPCILLAKQLEEVRAQGTLLYCTLIYCAVPCFTVRPPGQAARGGEGAGCTLLYSTVPCFTVRPPGPSSSRR